MRDLTGKFCNRVALLMMNELSRMETQPFVNVREYKRLCFHSERYVKRANLHNLKSLRYGV